MRSSNSARKLLSHSRDSRSSYPAVNHHRVRRLSYHGLLSRYLAQETNTRETVLFPQKPALFGHCPYQTPAKATPIDNRITCPIQPTRADEGTYNTVLCQRNSRNYTAKTRINLVTLC